MLGNTLGRSRFTERSSCKSFSIQVNDDLPDSQVTKMSKEKDVRVKHPQNKGDVKTGGVKGNIVSRKSG